MRSDKRAQLCARTASAKEDTQDDADTGGHQDGFDGLVGGALPEIADPLVNLFAALLIGLRGLLAVFVKCFDGGLTYIAGGLGGATGRVAALGILFVGHGTPLEEVVR